MDTNKNGKKILILGLILLIIAGLIVISLKGFEVSLMFGKHETVELKVGKEISMDTVKEICEEVFQKEEYIAKELEVFGDSFQINVKSITDDQKANLIAKINEKFETEKTVEDLNVNAISNKRIRDVVKPYVVPMLLVFLIVSVYALIRFRKINSFTLLIDFVGKIILTQCILLSIIAIVRIPVDDLVVNGLMVIAIAELVYFINQGENQLGKKAELTNGED